MIVIPVRLNHGRGVAEVVGYCCKNIDEGEVLCQGIMGPVLQYIGFGN